MKTIVITGLTNTPPPASPTAFKANTLVLNKASSKWTGLLLTEPFRLFFPFAVLMGCLGVLVWPLYFGGWLPFYPGQTHTRLMMEGFFSGFAIGFLGTAGPRLLGVKPIPKPITVGLATLFLAANGCHLMGKNLVGDWLFASLLFFGLGLILVGWMKRTDTPPPGFMSLPLACLCAWAGIAIVSLEARDELDSFWLTLRPLLLYQGFPLIVILAVCPFFLPRFFNAPNRHSFDTFLRPDRRWWVETTWTLGLCLGLVGSFFLEANGWARVSQGARAVLLVVFLWRTVPLELWIRSWKGQTISALVKGSMSLFPLAYLTIILWPAYRVALLHILLAGGLAGLLLLVATRVLAGHTGAQHLIKGTRKWLWTVYILILLGMSTRVSADFLPDIMISHYNYGALCWAAGILVWGWFMLPRIRMPDPDP